MSRDRKWLKQYPNLEAILEGRVSGQVTEWPAIRKELEALIDEYENSIDDMIYF